MSKYKFSFQNRIIEFWSKLEKQKFLNFGLLFYGVGWLFTFFLVFLNIDSTALIYLLPIHIFFWFKFVGIIRDQIRPPTEILLILFILIYLLDRVVINSAFSDSPILTGVSFTFGVQISFQILILGILTLLFSLILVQNQGKNWILLFFIFFGIISSYFFHKDAVFTVYFLQLLLLLFLLSKTNWLEKLTRTECWIYWIIIFFALSGLYSMDPLQSQIPQYFPQAQIWQKAPYYLFLLMRMYLLALLIKIPVILVYNHASLSRKLWISSLFQSSFPQFVQFFLLVSAFYFFISGWQAENFRTELTKLFKQVQSQQTPEAITHYQLDLSGNDSVVTMPGYLPVRIPRDLDGKMIIRAPRIQFFNKRVYDHFIVFKDSDSLSNSVHLVRIDSILLKLVTKNLPLIIGSKIKAYQFSTSNQVESFLYKMSTKQLPNVGSVFPFMLLPSGESNIGIFPFALISNKSESAISFQLDPNSGRIPLFLNMQIGNQNLQSRLTAGRVYLPVYNDENRDDFYAFDIIILPNFSRSMTPILRLLIFLAIVYFLINLLVTRRMVKFGEQINDRIVQKFSQLKTGIREIASGNLEYKVELEGEDEFVELAERFNIMGDKLIKTIEESVEKERLENELDMARQVQLDILPRKLPEIPGYQIAASLKTATEVGGDFYDVLPLSKDKFLISIGDVSGKGSYAALYMAQCMSLIRFSHHFTKDPAEIAIRLNNYFSDPMVDKQLFVTAVIGVLDSKRNRFKWVRAGHTQPLVVPGIPDTDIQEMISSGMGIGLTTSESIFKDKLEVMDLHFGPGDIWILYSDGLVEAAIHTGEEIEHYGIGRLTKLLANQSEKSAKQILTKLETDIIEFYQGIPSVDDYTLIVIKREKKV